MKIFRLLFLIGLLYACTESPHEGYRHVHDRLYYQLRYIGDSSDKIQVGHYLRGYLKIRKLKGDTLFYQPFEVNFQLKGNSGLDTIFNWFSIDDSVSVIWNGASLASLSVFVDKDTLQDVLIDMRITGSQPAAAYRSDSLLYLREAAMKEMLLLNSYLKAHGLTSADMREGMYFLPLVNSHSGIRPQTGNSVRVEYIGRYLDGRIFDATSKYRDSFVIEYGKSFQLIKGLEIALSWMNEGDEAKIILPSHLAFGEIGSAGTVPPYTTVVYQLKLAEIY